MAAEKAVSIGFRVFPRFKALPDADCERHGLKYRASSAHKANGEGK